MTESGKTLKDLPATEARVALILHQEYDLNVEEVDFLLHKFAEEFEGSGDGGIRRSINTGVSTEATVNRLVPFADKLIMMVKREK